MPFLRLLVDRVEAFVRRLMGGKKRVVPAHRSDSRFRPTRKPVFPSRAKAASPPRSVFQRRVDVTGRGTRHLNHAGHPAAIKPTPPRPPAVTSCNQQKKPPSTLGSHTPSSRTPPSKLSNQPSTWKIIPPTSKDLPPNPADLPLKSKSRRPKSKSLPPKPKGLPRESKQLPPNPKDLPPTPISQPQHPLQAPPATSFYSNAQGFNINQQNIYNTQTFSASKALFDYLEPHIAHGAAHNSDERCDAPKCHPETRVAVQGEIIAWIKDGSGGEAPKRIMWLSGPAGTGKTAIAGTIAETCKKDGILAASFFFSSFCGSENRYSKRCFIATLASHLAEHEVLHGFKAQVHKSIEQNPAFFHRCLREQAESLILAPLRSIRKHCSTVSWPTGIIIDGLDEVKAQQFANGRRTNREDDDDQLEILDALFTLVMDPAFPFRIFISSRPERVIEDFFLSAAHDLTLKLFLDSKYDPDADIARFLEAKFAAIRRRCGISDHSWPGQAVLDSLVEMSSGQFIVPAVIMRWLEGGVPQEQLEEVLKLEGVGTGSKNPFATLDAVYRYILGRAHNPEHDPHLVVKWILCITASTRRAMPGFPSNPPSAQFWRQFLEDKTGELNYRMTPITSLIAIPSATDSSSSRITIYHKSLADFLYSRTRCEHLYVKKGDYESFCADRVALVLKNKGPVIPPSDPIADLPIFFREFKNLKLLVTSVFAASDPICQDFSRFLGCLGKGAKDILASCDVAWWTSLLLGQAWGSERSLQGNGTLHITLLGGLYCGIHRAMECGCASTLDHPSQSSTQDTSGTTHQAQDDSCHAACKHWRKGILDQAKELNWCVHELERVGIGELENVTVLEFDQKFKPMLRSTCPICHPPPTVR